MWSADVKFGQEIRTKIYYDASIWKAHLLRFWLQLYNLNLC